MRKALRIVYALLLAYLVQAIMLPYFRVQGVVPDIVSVVLYTAGFTGGLYTALMTGAFGALVLEVLSGDLQGLTALTAVALPVVGMYVGIWTGRYIRNDNKRLERTVKRVVPIIAIGMPIALREAIFLIYFYLTGTELMLIHFVRLLICIVLTIACNFLLLSVTYRFILRDAKNTFLAKRIQKWKKRKKPKETKLAIKLPGQDEKDAGKTELPVYEASGEDSAFEMMGDFEWSEGITEISTAFEPEAQQKEEDEGGVDA